MFLITSGLDTDEVALCNWKLNVDAKRRVQKCPPWMNDEVLLHIACGFFFNKLLDFCFGEKRKSRIILRSLLPSSSDFALALCPEQRRVNDMWTHLLHSSQLPGFWGAAVLICAGSLAGKQCACSHWTSVPTHDCLVFRKKHRRKRCCWGRRSP